MTDAEKIIKGIKICSDDKSSCKGCPYYEFKSPICLYTLHKETTDLIRRQQTEINHFAEVNKMVIELKTVKNDDDEILRMLVNQSVKFIPRNDDIKAIQRDAVINFAENLKVFLLLSRPEQISVVSYEDIDNLVNKMFGNPEQVKGEENAEVKPC